MCTNCEWEVQHFIAHTILFYVDVELALQVQKSGNEMLHGWAECAHDRQQKKDWKLDASQLSDVMWKKFHFFSHSLLAHLVDISWTLHIDIDSRLERFPRLHLASSLMWSARFVDDSSVAVAADSMHFYFSFLLLSTDKTRATLTRVLSAVCECGKHAFSHPWNEQNNRCCYFVLLIRLICKEKRGKRAAN